MAQSPHQRERSGNEYGNLRLALDIPLHRTTTSAKALAIYDRCVLANEASTRGSSSLTNASSHPCAQKKTLVDNDHRVRASALADNRHQPKKWMWF